MRKVVPFIILAAVALTSPASAFFYNGNEMFDHCRANNPLLAGYVAGLHDASMHDRTTTVSGLRRAFTGRPVADFDVAVVTSIVTYCEPDSVTLGQMKDVFCRFLQNRPERRHLGAAVLFSEAMQKAWPCPP